MKTSRSSAHDAAAAWGYAVESARQLLWDLHAIGAARPVGWVRQETNAARQLWEVYR